MSLQQIKAKLGLNSEPPPPTSIYISVPDGDIEVTKHEADFFSLLFQIVDSNSDSAIGGIEGALFLSRSGLPREQLREIWRLSCGGVSKPKLNQDNWFIACKLVALTQHTGVCEIEPLLTASYLPFPDFDIRTSASIDHTPLPTLPASAIGVAIASPVTIGSGPISKHTSYTVTTSTSLPQFPVKEMVVPRRYSDFLWLHHRLCLVYPGCLIPRFPEKKFTGNLNPEFVEDRRRSLETYMSKVLHHPRLVTSIDVQIFCEASPAGLEAAKAAVAVLHSMAGEDSLFMKYLQSVTGSRSSVVVKADEAFIEQCNMSSAALNRLNRTVAASNAMMQQRKDVGYELSRIGTYFSHLATHERAGATAGAGATAAAEARAKEASKQIAAIAESTAMIPRSEAEAAFAAHASAGVAKSSGSIEDMFNVDFDDPFAGSLSAATAPSPARPVGGSAAGSGGGASGSGGVASSLVPSVVESSGDLFLRMGAEMEAMSNRMHDQLDTLDSIFFSPIRAEQEKEAEIQEAAARRSLAVDRMQASFDLLQRRKKDYAAIRASADGGVGGKAERADAECKQAEKRVEDAKTAVAGITEGLKHDMARIMAERRVNMIRRLLDFVKTEQSHARGRLRGWQDVLPLLSEDEEVIRESYAKVSAVPEVVPDAVAARSL